MKSEYTKKLEYKCQQFVGEIQELQRENMRLTYKLKKVEIEALAINTKTGERHI